MVPKIKSYPLVGSLPLLQNDPLNTFYQWFQEHGDTYHLKMLHKNVYMVCNPHDVEKVLKAKRDHMRRGEVYKMAYTRFGDGLAFGDGEQWQVERKVCGSVFGKKALESFFDPMLVHFDTVFNGYLEGKDLNCIDSEDLMLTLTLNLFLLAGFGRILNDETCQSIQKQADQLTKNYELDAASLWKRFQALFFYSFYKKNVQQETKHLDSLLRDFLSMYYSSNQEIQSEPTILTAFNEHFERLCQRKATEQEIIEFMRGLIFAGYETTGRGLTYFWYHLTKNSHCYDRVSEEIHQTLKDGPLTYHLHTELDYTLRTWYESLRLSPSIPCFGREPVQPIELSQVTVHPGEWIWLSPYITGRHPRYWGEDYLRFNPDRFLPEEVSKRPKCAWYPFSYYGFGCVGQAFANMEATIIVAKIMQKYHVELVAPDELHHELQLTTSAKEKVKIKLSPRT